MIARLRVIVEERYGGIIARWSRAHRKTRSLGSAILKGKREPTATMLAEAGMVSVKKKEYGEKEGVRRDGAETMSSPNENLRASIKRRLAKIEEEAEHLRGLLALYQAAGKPTAACWERKKRRGVVYGARWAPLAMAMLASESERAIREIADAAGFSSNRRDRNLLRSQLHNWKRRGWVASPEMGVFCLTDAGRKAFTDRNDEPDDAP